jgi:hypothetical protein
VSANCPTAVSNGLTDTEREFVRTVHRVRWRFDPQLSIFF